GYSSGARGRSGRTRSDVEGGASRSGLRRACCEASHLSHLHSGTDGRRYRDGPLSLTMRCNRYWRLLLVIGTIALVSNAAVGHAHDMGLSSAPAHFRGDTSS